MRIQETRAGAVAVLAVLGDLDAAALPPLESRLWGLIDEGVRAVVVDLGGVVLLPSTGAGLLLSAARRLRALGGRLALAAARRPVRGTLGTMGILGVLPLFETSDAAVRSLEGPAPAAPGEVSAPRG